MTKRILVPMDDSPPAEAALEYALDAFGDREATVVVLHVYNPVEAGYGAEPLGGDSGAVGECKERVERAAGAVFERARAMAAKRQTTVETATATGSPPRAIVEYAEEHGVDHIVMGSHGRRGVSRILLGSVSETVVRRASVPVTVVR